MRTLHPKSNQTQTSKDLESARGEQHCAPAACVLDGVKARDLMLIEMDGRRGPSAYALYPEAHGTPNLQVRVVPTGQCLSDLAKSLRTIADQLDTLYADFADQRQGSVDAIRETVERLVDLSEAEKEQVWALCPASHSDYDDVPF